MDAKNSYRSNWDFHNKCIILLAFEVETLEKRRGTSCRRKELGDEEDDIEGSTCQAWYHYNSSAKTTWGYDFVRMYNYTWIYMNIQYFAKNEQKIINQLMHN